MHGEESAFENHRCGLGPSWRGGPPLALRWQGMKSSVWDVDRERVRCMHAGQSPMYEPGLQDRVGEAVERGLLRVAHRDEVEEDLGNVALITVGAGAGCLSAECVQQVADAVVWVRNRRSPDLTLVMKSTVLPGAGRRILASELAGAGISYVAKS